MQDIGEQQFLMLLLMMEADLEHARKLGKGALGHHADQLLHCRIDMRAIVGDALRIRARDQTALRPRVTRAGGDIIGIEQKREVIIEGHVIRHMRLQQELLEEPCGVRAVPLGRTGIRHRLHDLVFRRQTCGTALRFRPDRAKGIQPKDSIDASASCELFCHSTCTQYVAGEKG